MLAEALIPAAAAAGLLAWGVRGKSSQLLGPTIWRGPSTRRAIALTFDDGPSESTEEILRLLDDFGARATFFQCGHHVRRLPKMAERVATWGHEIGNHTDSHPALYFRSHQFIHDQISRAQELIQGATGVTPTLFRPPFGARWFGLSEALWKLNLTSVMWTAIARDWTLNAGQIAAYLAPRAKPGAILCFHDGRELIHHPDIGNTMGALKILLPKWLAVGYEITTVTGLLTGQNVPSAPSAGPAPR